MEALDRDVLALITRSLTVSEAANLSQCSKTMAAMINPLKFALESADINVCIHALSKKVHWSLDDWTMWCLKLWHQRRFSLHRR